MVQEASVPFSSTSPKTTVAFDVLRNDVLVAFSTMTDHQTSVEVTNSDTDLGWTLYQFMRTTGRPSLGVWAAAPIADMVGLTVTFTKGGPNSMSGTVLNFRGALGVGTTALRHAASGQPSMMLTTTHPNSAIVNVGSFERDTTGTSRAWRTADASAVTEVTYTVVAGEHTEITGYHTDAGVAGAKEVGLTGLLDGFKAYAFVAMEIMTNDLPEALLYTKAR